jgi:hypothetical protein
LGVGLQYLTTWRRFSGIDITKGPCTRRQ